MTSPAFSLVIPCYNEASSLKELYRRSLFVAQEGGGEVILVNNGSTDDTSQILHSLTSNDQYVRSVTVVKNVGYGHGIRAGLAVARAPIVGWTHADLQTDPADILRVLPALSGAGRYFAKGRRYGRPAFDRFFTAGMSIFETLLLRRPVRDINAQPTVFSRELLDIWTSPPDDFSLDLYAYYVAMTSGYRIIRFPVLFAPRRHGVSHWNVGFAGKWKFIRRTLAFSFKLRRTL